MLWKTGYEKAAASVGKAEVEVRKQIARLAEIDDAVSAAVLEMSGVENRMDSVFKSDASIKDMEIALDQGNSDRDRYGKRIDEYQRMRLHQSSNVLTAKIALLEAEGVAHRAQREHYTNAAAESLAACMKACRPHLRDLEINTSAAAYYAGLAKSELTASMAWNAADPFDAMREAFIAETKPILESMSMDDTAKGAPPIKPIKSPELSSNDRTIIEEMQRSGFKVDTVRWTAAIAKQSELVPQNADNRYRPSEQISYWTDRLVMLERSMEYEKTREYPTTTGDGRPLNEAAARKLRIAHVQAAMDEAKLNVTNWQQAIDRKSVA